MVIEIEEFKNHKNYLRKQDEDTGNLHLITFNYFILTAAIKKHSQVNQYYNIQGS